MAFAGNILHVDLTNRKTWTEPVDPEMARQYLGGRGINARLLMDHISEPGIDPLGPDNVIVFGTGSLSGTHAPSSGRTTVTFKSPATNLYCKCSAGGYWGARLKFAGYDHVVVRGRSETPVYLWISNDGVEIRDASHLWGHTIPEADAMIKEEVGLDNIETAMIGQAGENLVRIASVMVSLGFAAARGGSGAVMGSKNLKGIAVRGTGTLDPYDAEVFDQLAIQTRMDLARDSASDGLHMFGTSGLVEGLNASDTYPSFNFRQGHIDPCEPLSGPYLVDKGFLKGRIGCGACGISCHRYCTVDDGPYAGTRISGPEYESMSSLGSGCGIIETAPVIKASGLCNEYGLDTISAGGVIQWAMESYEKGVLTDEETGGLRLEWGSGDAVVEMVRQIAFREGLGDLLADGVRVAAQKTGGDSWKWAVESKGMEQSRVETRCAKSYALAFAVNPRGPDHLCTEALAEFGLTEEARQLIKKICGDEKYAVPYMTEKRAEIVRWHEDCYAITDAMGFCAFSTTWSYAVTPENMAQMFAAATGLEMDEEQAMLAGRRIVTLERMFNMREGASRKDDVLPWRVMNEPMGEGPKKGAINSKEELDGMLDEYYQLHGWDIETGVPRKDTLESLGLGDLATG